MTAEFTAPAEAARQLKAMCRDLRLSTIGPEAVERFVRAGHGEAPDALLEIFRQELDATATSAGWTACGAPRGCRRARTGRVLTWTRCRRSCVRGCATCSTESSLPTRSALFSPAYRLAQDLLAARRDLELPRLLRRLDPFEFLIIDDLGYLPQDEQEADALFTLDRRALRALFDRDHLQPGVLRAGQDLPQSHGHRGGHRPHRPPCRRTGI